MGRDMVLTASPIKSPIPEYCSTYLSTPPQAVTSKMRPVGSNDLVMTFSSSSVLYPWPMPKINMAATVAISRATKGSPKKAKTGCQEASAGTTPVTESRIISTRGMRIIPTMAQKLGSLDSSKSS